MKNILFNNKLENLLETASLSEADEVLCQIMHNVGFDQFSYNYYPKATDSLLHVLCTEQSLDWQTHYRARQYEKIDSVHNLMRKSLTPLKWKIEEELKKCGNEQKQLFLEAMEFGLRGGFAIPIHSAQGEFANLVVQDVSILDQIKKQPDIEYTLYLAAHYYHARVCHFLEKLKTTEFSVHLTTRETECLRLTSEHKSAKEIAHILNISPRTASFHIENAIKKFRVTNKYQAVTKAVQSGLLG